LAAELLKLIEDSLKAVENQKANTDKYGGLEKGPATYSVVKQARDNDADLHTNNTVSFMLCEFHTVLRLF